MSVDDGARTSPPGGHVDVYTLDMVDPERLLAVSVELIVGPRPGRLGVHWSIHGFGRKLISLVDLEADEPRPPSLEARAPGLWIEYLVQRQLEHVTLDLEAFAVELDQPDDVFRGGYGTRVPLGAELEWESSPGDIERLESGFRLPAVCHGELLIGTDAVELDGFGWRSRRNGPADAIARTEQLVGPPGSAAVASTLSSAPVPDPIVGGAAVLEQRLERTSNGALMIDRRRGSPIVA